MGARKGWTWLVGMMVLGCGGGGVVDTIPPEVREVQVSPSSLVRRGQEVTVEATVVDEGSGVERVEAQVAYPDGSSRGEEMGRGEGDRWRVVFPAQWDAGKVEVGAEGLVVRVVVVAHDGAGNEGRSGERQVRATLDPPTPPPEL